MRKKVCSRENEPKSAQQDSSKQTQTSRVHTPGQLRLNPRTQGWCNIIKTIINKGQKNSTDEKHYIKYNIPGDKNTQQIKIQGISLTSAG